MAPPMQSYLSLCYCNIRPPRKLHPPSCFCYCLCASLVAECGPSPTFCPCGASQKPLTCGPKSLLHRDLKRDCLLAASSQHTWEALHSNLPFGALEQLQALHNLRAQRDLVTRSPKALDEQADHESHPQVFEEFVSLLVPLLVFVLVLVEDRNRALVCLKQIPILIQTAIVLVLVRIVPIAIPLVLELAI